MGEAVVWGSPHLHPSCSRRMGSDMCVAANGAGGSLLASNSLFSHLSDTDQTGYASVLLLISMASFFLMLFLDEIQRDGNKNSTVAMRHSSLCPPPWADWISL